MYELARPAIYSYSIQRGTPHVNLRQKRASLFNSQILVVALIGIFGGLKPKMCVHFSKDWRSEVNLPELALRFIFSYPSSALHSTLIFHLRPVTALFACLTMIHYGMLVVKMFGEPCTPPMSPRSFLSPSMQCLAGVYPCKDISDTRSAVWHFYTACITGYVNTLGAREPS